MSSAQSLRSLQEAYSKQSLKGSLNTAVRKALRMYAAAERLSFCQDSGGNIYIRRQGRDPELADIAIAFPLDEDESPQLFTSAFIVFNQLASDDLVCGLTLFGCTSVGGTHIGLRLWENSAAASKLNLAAQTEPVLEQFSSFPSPSDFSFSALFEVSEAGPDGLRMRGSPLLLAKAQKHAQDQISTKTSTQASSRAPSLLVEGRSAEVVVRRTICAYSEYIAALFDNFD